MKNLFILTVKNCGITLNITVRIVTVFSKLFGLRKLGNARSVDKNLMTNLLRKSIGDSFAHSALKKVLFTHLTGEKIMRQSKFSSFIEANTNAIIGLIVSFLFTYYALPIFNFYPSAGQSVVITICYFILSVTRSFIIRRIFDNYLTLKRGKIYGNLS